MQHKNQLILKQIQDTRSEEENCGELDRLLF